MLKFYLAIGLFNSLLHLNVCLFFHCHFYTGGYHNPGNNVEQVYVSYAK